MKTIALGLFLYFFQGSFADVPGSKILKCAVCHTIVNEIHKAIRQVDPRKKVEVGSFRIKPDGRQERSTKKYAGSEAHMTELLDSLCSGFGDFAQARHKETKKIEVIQLVINGKMNPRFGEYEIIEDPELNKGVQFHCESILEDYEDNILEYFPKHIVTNEEVSKHTFCTKQTKICPDVKQEL